MLGVVKLTEPVDNNIPPVEALYQSIVSPAPALADKITLPTPQDAASEPIGIEGNGLIVAMTAVREVDEHPLDDST